MYLLLITSKFQVAIPIVILFFLRAKKQQPLISMLDLKQNSKSVKYMTSNEREEAKGKLEKQERYEKLTQVRQIQLNFLRVCFKRSQKINCNPLFKL